MEDNANHIVIAGILMNDQELTGRLGRLAGHAAFLLQSGVDVDVLEAAC